MMIPGEEDYRRGNDYSDRGDWRSAIDSYTKSIRLLPSHFSFMHYNRGIAYCHIGDYGRAKADFEEALRRDPNQPGARQNLEVADNALREGLFGGRKTEKAYEEYGWVKIGGRPIVRGSILNQWDSIITISTDRDGVQVYDVDGRCWGTPDEALENLRNYSGINKRF